MVVGFKLKLDFAALDLFKIGNAIFSLGAVDLRDLDGIGIVRLMYCI